MKRNAFGQLISTSAPLETPPYLRFFAPPADTGAGGDDDGKGGDGGGGDGFKPPQSQEELDRIIADRVARADRKAREDERAKLTAKPKDDKPSDDKKPADDGKPVVLTEADVQKQIEEARAADRLELAMERAGDALDKALEGRTFSASKVLSLDLKQFVAEDGKSVDQAKLAEWVKENTAEAVVTDTKRRRLPGQGERDANAAGGSVSAGRDLYDETHPKKSSGKD